MCLLTPCQSYAGSSLLGDTYRLVNYNGVRPKLSPTYLRTHAVEQHRNSQWKSTAHVLNVIFIGNDSCTGLAEALCVRSCAHIMTFVLFSTMIFWKYEAVPEKALWSHERILEET